MFNIYKIKIGKTGIIYARVFPLKNRLFTRVPDLQCTPRDLSSIREAVRIPNRHKIRLPQFVYYALQIAWRKFKCSTMRVRFFFPLPREASNGLRD